MKGAALAFLGQPPAKPPQQPDAVQFGLNYTADYGLERWHTWQKSQGAVYPNGQGRDAQSPSLMEDFRAYDAEFSYWIDRFRKELESRK